MNFEESFSLYKKERSKILSEFEKMLYSQCESLVLPNGCDVVLDVQHEIDDEGNETDTLVFNIYHEGDKLFDVSLDSIEYFYDILDEMLDDCESESNSSMLKEIKDKSEFIYELVKRLADIQETYAELVSTASQCELWGQTGKGEFYRY